MNRFILLLAGLPLLFSCTREAPPKPNILFIAIDDLKPALGCYGDREMLSPHIDEIASRGTLFLNNHCQQAVCGPSRASLLTGRYPDRIRVWGFYSFRDRNPGIITLPQHFRNNGYTTINISKIFDYRTVGPGMDTVSWSRPYFPMSDAEMAPYYAEETGPVAAYFYHSAAVKEVFREKVAETENSGGNPNQLTHRVIKPATECLDLPDDAYKDGVFAERAIEELHRLAGEKDPFFLAVGFERPHLPWTAPKRYWDLYERDSINLEPFREHAQNDKPYFYTLSNELRSYTDEAGNDAWGKLAEGIPLTSDEQRKLIHGYRAAVSYIDAQVGRMISALEELQLTDNTIIVVWGDHGWHLGDHGIWGKSTNFEQATRSPMIISMPGMEPGTTSRPTEFVDLFPTLCELAGIGQPDSLQGESLVPLLKDGATKTGQYAFSQFTRDERMGYAIRDERYRYVEWMETGRHVDPGAGFDRVVDRQLFDYETDPLERVNVAGMPGYASVEDTLRLALHRWLRTVGR